MAESIFAAGAESGGSSQSDNQYNLGTKFSVTVPGTITKIRWYAGTGESGNHNAQLYSGSTLIDGTTYTASGSGPGWVEYTLPTPVSVTTGITYTVAVSTGSDAGNVYYAESGVFNASGDNGEHITWPASAGTYVVHTRTTFPTDTYQGASYFRDVVFEPEDTSAYPAVESVTPTTFATSVTDHAVAMPGTINAGELKLALISSDGSTVINTPSGWDQLANQVSGTAGRLSVYARIHVGGDPATVNWTTNTGEQLAAQVYRISNWKGAITGGVEARTAEASTSATPDPSSFSPSWGSAANLWITVASDSSTATLTTAPSSYGNTQTTSSATGTTAAQLYSARLLLEAATSDPGTWTFSATGNRVLTTIAIAPQADVIVSPVTSPARDSAVPGTVVLGPVSVSPVTAAERAAAVTGSVLIEWPSVTVSPVTAAAQAASVPGTVVHGPITISPKTAPASAASVPGSVLYGSIAVPAVTSADTAGAVPGTTVLGSLSLPGTAADEAAAVPGTVIHGPVSVTATAAGAAGAVPGSVVHGSLAIPAVTSPDSAASVPGTVLYGSTTVAATVAPGIAASVPGAVLLGSTLVPPQTSAADDSATPGDVVLGSTSVDTVTSADYAGAVPGSVFGGGEVVSDASSAEQAAAVPGAVLLGSTLVPPVTAADAASAIPGTTVLGSTVVSGVVAADTAASVPGDIGGGGLTISAGLSWDVAGSVPGAVVLGSTSAPAATAADTAASVPGQVVRGSITISGAVSSDTAGSVSGSVVTEWPSSTVSGVVSSDDAGAVYGTVILGSVTVTGVIVGSVGAATTGGIEYGSTTVDSVASAATDGVIVGQIVVGTAGYTITGVVSAAEDTAYDYHAILDGMPMVKVTGNITPTNSLGQLIRHLFTNPHVSKAASYFPPGESTGLLTRAIIQSMGDETLGALGDSSLVADKTVVDVINVVPVKGGIIKIGDDIFRITHEPMRDAKSGVYSCLCT